MNSFNEMMKLVEKLDYLGKKLSDEEVKRYFMDVIKDDSIKQSLLYAMKKFDTLTQTLYYIADIIETGGKDKNYSLNNKLH